MEKRLIDKLAEKHLDWIKMAKSFRINNEQANELVQSMYIRLVKYVDVDSDRIMYTKEEVNTYYVYVTLRNLYLSQVHSYKSDYDIFEPVVHNESYINEDLNMRYEQAHKNLFDKVDEIVDNWYWYDKKLWGIHFNGNVSMRGIASDTKISLSSIFNTLKNGKEKIRKQVQKEYKDYCEAKTAKAEEKY